MSQPPPDYLHDLWTHGREGLHVVSPDAMILDANPADYEPLGYTREEYVGHDIRKFHVDAHVIADILQRLVAGQPIINQEARLRCKDGSIRIVSINSDMRRDCDGRMLHTRCFTRDITEIAALRQQIDRQARAMQEMAVPIFEVAEGILAAPIVGILDSQRAALLTEELLTRLARERARYAIVDLTGILAVDTATAQHLMRTVDSAALVGSTVVLTGIGAEVAQTIVSMGVDLGRVVTRGRMRDGIEWCAAAARARTGGCARDGG